METNTITLPNGNTITKTSKRKYTHAVVIGFTNGNWAVGAWSSSEQGAHRAISQAKAAFGLFADDAQVLVMEVK
jgi:hypothetical protein